MKENLAKADAKKAAQTAPKRNTGAHGEAKKVTTKAPVGKAKKPDAHGAKNQYISEITRQLKFFTEPDFSKGCDYWPKLDARLNGQIPGLIQQAIEALDSAYHGEKRH